MASLIISAHKHTSTRADSRLGQHVPHQSVCKETQLLPATHFYCQCYWRTASLLIPTHPLETRRQHATTYAGMSRPCILFPQPQLLHLAGAAAVRVCCKGSHLLLQ